MRCSQRPPSSLSFFFKEAPTTEIYTLSLHDALPIWNEHGADRYVRIDAHVQCDLAAARFDGDYITRLHLQIRSEEHTSELQSRENLVCRLLLEKKKKTASLI